MRLKGDTKKLYVLDGTATLVTMACVDIAHSIEQRYALFYFKPLESETLLLLLSPSSPPPPLLLLLFIYFH